MAIRGQRARGRDNLEAKRVLKAMDAYNAGYRSVARGDTGDEPRYLGFVTGHPKQFAKGRRDAEMEAT